MNSFMDDIYRFEVENVQNKNAFLEYLKIKIKEIIDYKLSFYVQGDPEFLYTTFTFWLEDPPISYGENNIINELNYIASQETEGEILVEEQAENLIQGLQNLSPLEEEPLKVELTLKEIILDFIKQLSFFSVTTVGVTKHYFGIKINAWFTGKPILLDTVLRAVDFGTEDTIPLHLFDFVIFSVKQNFVSLYQKFIEDLEKNKKQERFKEVQDANYSEL